MNINAFYSFMLWNTHNERCIHFKVTFTRSYPCFFIKKAPQWLEAHHQITSLQASSLAMFMHPSASQPHAGIQGCPILSQRQACVRHLLLHPQVTSSKQLLGTDGFRNHTTSSRPSVACQPPVSSGSGTSTSALFACSHTFAW